MGPHTLGAAGSYTRSGGADSSLIPGLRLEKLSGTAPQAGHAQPLQRSLSHGSLQGSRKPARCHPSTALPLVKGVKGVCRLFQCRLFVARRGEGGTFYWEPLRFVYHSHGDISFRRSGVDIILDIDWSRPFHAAPMDPQESNDGLTLYPWELVYEPKFNSTKTHNKHPKRYVALFGAVTPSERREWLSLLWQKASVIKACSSTMLAREAMLRSEGALDDSAGWHDDRPKEILGEEEHELLRPGAKDIVLQPLPGGAASLWSKETNLSVVQDLYSSYASDPLSRTRILKDHHYFLKYLRRQAEIEELLKEKEQSNVEQANDAQVKAIDVWPPSPPAIKDDLSPVSSFHSSRNRNDAGGNREIDDQILPSRFEISKQTSNINVSGQMLSNEQWSGAVTLVPRDPHSFRLTIRLVDSPKTHPVFLGIVPAGADLNAVNLHDNEGYFLRIDGAREAFCCGNKGEQWCSLERITLKEDSSVGVHFVENNSTKFGARMVCFIGEGAGGDEVFLQPRFSQPIPPGKWQPCVLMCLPGTHIWLTNLI